LNLSLPDGYTMKTNHMKSRIALILGLLLSATTIHAENPERETVYSIVKQRQSTDWYRTQAELWETHLEKNKADATAWLNFYTAKRMLKIYQKGVTQDDLNQIVKDVEQAIPNTFERHYITYWNGGAGDAGKNVDHLMEAQKLGPDRIELYDDLFTHYELLRDKNNTKVVAQKWFASNDISTGIYNWNYNMLASTEQDAILITAGDNDTYPAWVLQQAKDIRTDVAVWNSSLLGIPEYRNELFKEAGIPSLEDTFEAHNNWHTYQRAILEHIKAHTQRPLYFAVSVQPELYEDFSDEVHNVGMAYKWSPEKFDNIAVTKKNFEKEYLTDYLKVDFGNDISQGVIDHANANYLIPLITLFNHYSESEDEKAAEMQALIERIAEKNNMESQVAEVLKTEPRAGESLVVDDPRDLTKEFVLISNGRYALRREVTNEMYELFLTDLLKQKRFEDLVTARSEKVDWKAQLPDDKKHLSEEDIFQNGSPMDPDFPVVNISHKAAELYCEWLTDVYNNSQHKKKKHNRVAFRLPTEKEWEELALGGKSESAYAWGGPYVRNAQGCFLGNLNSMDVDPKPGENLDYADCSASNLSDIDGGYFPVVTLSYMPNDFGLYNMTGNVAEMVQEPGKAKGGSWLTPAGHATINSVEKIEGPASTLGFRVIMDVIE